MVVFVYGSRSSQTTYNPDGSITQNIEGASAAGIINSLGDAAQYHGNIHVPVYVYDVKIAGTANDMHALGMLKK